MSNPLHDIVYGPGVIPDHNSEGYDSVDSEDFDIGFGCVVEQTEIVVPGPPDIPQDKDREILYWNLMKEEERMRIEQRHLEKYGI